jgi:hypothetical protein
MSIVRGEFPVSEFFAAIETGCVVPVVSLIVL